MANTLFNLSDEILALEADLDREDLTDEQREALIDAWLESQGDVEIKLDNYCALIKEKTARAKARREAVKEMEALITADENLAEKLKERIQQYFRRHKLTRFETGRYKIHLQASGGIAPLIYPEAWRKEPASAPEAFHRPVILLDTELIRKTVADFYAKAEEVTKTAKNDQERRRLFAQWIEFDEEARKTKELIEGCEIGPRGEQVRIR